MEKRVWRARIKPNMRDEYKRRHDELWPEMTQMLKEAGVHNYTIWWDGEVLIGYYETEEGNEKANRVQAQSAVRQRWDEYMKDVMEWPRDPQTGEIYEFECLFSLQ